MNLNLSFRGSSSARYPSEEISSQSAMLRKELMEPIPAERLLRVCSIGAGSVVSSCGTSFCCCTSSICKAKAAALLPDGSFSDLQEED
eukprot:11156271-Prorocentrum_lima.AAC.1